jgi:ankyrin repeat protein
VLAQYGITTGGRCGWQFRPTQPRGQTQFRLLLLEAGADPSAAAADGSTPLHEAVRRMNAGSVAVLCRFGADRRAVDHQGRTPAELLAHEDSNDEARALILSAMS